jgi:dolichyl-diphosphooligosaccharide--protein glycosyltransferase
MTDVRAATADLLEERPDLEDDLRALLAVDDGDPWTFDEIPLDSGSFGEIVAADIVKKSDGQYRLRDPDAVRAVLDGTELGHADVEDAARRDVPISLDSSGIRRHLADVDRVLVGTLVASLALVIVLRTAFSWNAVFRGDHLVLLGNDPYFYRFWLEELVRTDPSLGSMPARLQDHDVLMVATLWAVSTLAGGGTTAVGQVLTWYPVAAAVLVGGLVYKTTVAAFTDRRVGLASVALYATTPIVAYRSALGYGDHHAFDYLLVALALFGLVCLAGDDADWRAVTRRRVSGAFALCLGVAAQVHAWRGGPLLLLPIAVYIVVRAATDVRADRSPLRANVWVLGSLGAAAVLAAVPHALFGWAGLYRAVAPALLWGGSGAVVGAGMLARRLGVGGREVLAAELGGGLLVAGLAWIGLPPVRAAATRGVGYFVRTGQTGIAETASLFRPEFGVVTSPLFYLGVGFVFGTAALVGVTYAIGVEDRPVWIGVAAYGWTFLCMSVVQLRFAGQLGIVLSVLGGVGFVYLLAAVDLASGLRLSGTEGATGRARFRGEAVEVSSLSLPDRRTVATVCALFLVVGGFGGLQAASGAQALAVEDSTFEAATAIDDHAAATDTTWPQNYVFSEWDWNRAYNYYVNGQSRSYAYAQRNYGEFVTSTTPEGWYERLSEKPTGYVAVGPPGDGANPPSEVMKTRLWNNWGSATAETSGVSHYRAVYANEERKVYELVRGATLVGESRPGSEVVVTTEVTIDERTFTYRHQSKANPYGIYSVTVPYSGTYEVSETRVQIAEDGIHNGTRYILHDREGRAHWPFNTEDKQFVYDRVGGFTGMIQGATRVDGMTGRALSFDGTDDQVTIASDAGRGVRLLDPNGSVTISFWMRGSLEPSRSRYPTVLTQHSVGNGTVWEFWARTGGADDFGVRVDDRTGTTVKNFGIDTTNFSQWTHVVAVLDRGGRGTTIVPE